MSRWTITFGQRYRTDDHPTFLPAHPDGYVVIDVPDDHEAFPDIAARQAAFALLGSQWSNLHDMADPEWQADALEYYSRGQIGLIEWTAGSGWQFVEPHGETGPDGEPHLCWCKIREAHETSEPEPHPFVSDGTGDRCSECGRREGTHR